VLTDRELGTALAAMVAVDLFFFLPYATGTGCEEPLSRVSLAMGVLLAMYKAATVAGGVLLAARSRNIHIEQFDERRELALALYSFGLSMSVLAPVSFFLRFELQPVFVLRGLGLSLATLAAVCIFLAPKFYRVWLGDGSGGVGGSGVTASASGSGYAVAKGPSAARPPQRRSLSATSQSSAVDGGAAGQQALVSNPLSGMPRSSSQNWSALAHAADGAASGLSERRGSDVSVEQSAAGDEHDAADADDATLVISPALARQHQQQSRWPIEPNAPPRPFIYATPGPAPEAIPEAPSPTSPDHALRAQAADDAHPEA
jgi:hypothetical protein